MSEWLVWLLKIEPKSMEFCDLAGVKKKYRMRKGIPLLEEWPEGARFSPNPQHPKRNVLVDCPFNSSSYVIISERLRQFLADRGVEGVEFLPVRVFDLEEQEIDARYYVLNCVPHLDCLDRAASQAEESMMTDDVDNVQGIVLKNVEALEGLELARLAGFAYPTLIRRELADAMTEQGFTGIRFGELADFRDKTW